VIIARDDRTVRALSYLARFRATGSWQAAGGGEARRIVEIELGRIVADTRLHVIRRDALAEGLPQLVSTLRAAAWTIDPSSALEADDIGLLRLLVTALTEPDHRSSEEARRLHSGVKGLRQPHLVEQLLRTIGYSQGDSSPSAIDAAQLLDALRVAPTLPDERALAGPIAAYGKLLNSLVGPTQLSRRLEAMRATMPDLTAIGDDVDGLVRDLGQALTTLKGAGKLSAAVVNLGDLASRLRDPAAKIERLRTTIATIDGLSPTATRDVLLALADAASRESAEEVSRWIDDCGLALNAIESLGDASSSDASPLARALTKLDESVQELEREEEDPS
jgi:hypothetical protein